MVSLPLTALQENDGQGFSCDVLMKTGPHRGAWWENDKKQMFRLDIRNSVFHREDSQAVGHGLRVFVHPVLAGFQDLTT